MENSLLLEADVVAEIIIEDYNLSEISKPTSFSSNFTLNYSIPSMTLTFNTDGHGHDHDNNDDDEIVQIPIDYTHATYKSATLAFDPNNQTTLYNLDFCLRFCLHLDQNISLRKEIFHSLKTYLDLNPQPAALVVTINLVKELEATVYDPELEVLKKVRVEDMGFKDGEEHCCSICLENLGYEKNVMVSSMPCKHVFHHCCITKWFKTAETCPVCRYDLRDHICSMLREQQWEDWKQDLTS